MIESFAYLYVMVLEPLLQVFAIIVAIVTVVWLVMLMTDAKKGAEFFHSFFAVVGRATLGFLRAVGMGLWYGFLFTVRAVQVAVAAIRDFFISPV
ncbi:MAG: hypothetical protein WAX89_03640 [Alphaproteobacteria bacterium]